MAGFVVLISVSAALAGLFLYRSCARSRKNSSISCVLIIYRLLEISCGSTGVYLVLVCVSCLWKV